MMSVGEVVEFVGGIKMKYDVTIIGELEWSLPSYSVVALPVATVCMLVELRFRLMLSLVSAAAAVTK